MLLFKACKPALHFFSDEIVLNSFFYGYFGLLVETHIDLSHIAQANEDTFLEKDSSSGGF